MKSTTKKFLLGILLTVCLTVLLALCAGAEDVTYSEGLEFTSNGDGTCYVSGIGTCMDTEIVIPSVSFEGDKVTGIGEGAFYKCTNLTSVVIPQGIHYIEDSAFLGCYSLSNVIFPEGVKNIGEDSFAGCDSLNSVIIPEGLVTIGDGGFSGCDNLTSISLPESLMSIGEDAFSQCGNLVNIKLPPNLTTIEEHAFWNCSNLKSITIPGSVWRINEHVFCGCSNLTDVIMLSGVQRIEVAAFVGCSSLKNISIPDSVAHVDAAFNGCTSLPIYNGVRYADKWAIGYREGITHVSLRWDTVGIAVNAFGGCSKLKRIDIPEGVKYIGQYAFGSCSSLSSIHIPQSVRSIGEWAFAYCGELANISVATGNPTYHSSGNCLIYTSGKRLLRGCFNSVIPSDGSVKFIEETAFSSCKKLETLVLPDGLWSVLYDALWGCENIKRITIPRDIKYFDWSVGRYQSVTDVFYRGTKAEWDKDYFANDAKECFPNATIHFLGEPIKTGVYYDRVSRLWLDKNGESAQGIAICLDSETRYFIAGVPKRQGAITDANGYVYYFNSSLKAVRGQTYAIGESMTNGFIPAGVYTVDEQGRLVDGRGELVRAETAMADGFKYFADGTIQYYVNGKAARVGLVADEEGNFYYFNSTLKAVRGTKYSFSSTMSNGLLPAGTYYFDETGKLILP